MTPIPIRYCNLYADKLEQTRVAECVTIRFLQREKKKTRRHQRVSFFINVIAGSSASRNMYITEWKLKLIRALSRTLLKYIIVHDSFTHQNFVGPSGEQRRNERDKEKHNENKTSVHTVYYNQNARNSYSDPFPP